MNVSWAQHSWTLFSGVHGDYFFTNDSHPCDFFIQNGGHSGNLCSTGSLSFYHDFFLGIRLNSLLEITAFAFNPSNCSMMATGLCTSLYDTKTFCCCQTQILFTLLIAELNIVTLCWMVSRSFDLVIPFIYRFFPPSRKIKSSIM